MKWYGINRREIFKFQIMKTQNQTISVDQFRLQLNELMDQQKQLRTEVITQQLPFIYRIKPFPLSISRVASWIYFSLNAVFLLQTMDIYLTLVNRILNGKLSSPFQLSQFLAANSMIGYYTSSALLVVIVISIIFHKKGKYEGVLLLFSEVGFRTYPYLRYILEIFLLSTSYFAMGGDAVMIIFFSIAAVAILFSTLVLQNFTLVKDQFCCKSVPYSLLFRIIMIVAFTLNIACFMSVLSKNGLIMFCLFHLLNSTVLIINYFIFGLTIYRHPIPRRITFIITVFYLGMAISMFYDIVTMVRSNTNETFIYLYLIIIIFVSFFFCSVTVIKLRRYSNDSDNKNLRRKVYFFLNKYENAHQIEEQDSEIRGTLYHHMEQGCRNPECVVNLKLVYDSKKKKYVSISKIGQFMVSLIKFYVKCLFQNAVQADHENIDLLLDFLQFHYLKLKNIFLVMKMIAELEHRYLSFFQKLRLIRLKELIKQQGNSFSQDLYLKSLSMQNVVQSEEYFKRIQKSIEIVLRRNELFWRYIERSQVNLNDILSVIRPNFSLVDCISTDWAQIGHYFDINRRWKFYYLCFTLYVRNEKLLPSALQDFGNSVEFDSIFRSSNYFIDKTTDKQLLYNSIMLFEQNTCFVHTRCNQEKMTITRVSSYFTKNFEYDNNDIIHSPLQILMTPTIKKAHHSVFLKWVKQGRSNNEEYYSVKKVFPLTKRGFITPCFKFYKRYITISGEIQYIAMLKRNKQDQFIIITNEDFQIQAITEGFAHKLRLGKGDINYLKGLNLLSLMPMLVKYTKYAGLISEADQDFLQNDENKNYFRKQSTYIKQGNTDYVDIASILNQKKHLNLVNMKLVVPNDLQMALETYNHCKFAGKYSIFDSMKQTYIRGRKSKSFSKYKTEIGIRQCHILDNIYYEIEVNEIEDNNRLSKIKMEELQSEQQMSSTNSIQNVHDHKLSGIDIELFFQVNKKKSKVVLFPSNNIFLKDETNKALEEISHIKNINLSIRVSLFLFILLILIQLVSQLVISADIKLLNSQYYWISHHQKVSSILNTQYNIQHMQLDTGIPSSFYIVEYTHELFNTMENMDFLLLINDKNKNIPNLYSPYFKVYPDASMKKLPFPSLDELQIFYKMFETAISLHRQTQENSTNPLQNKQFHYFNNYFPSYYSKADQIKSTLVLFFEQEFFNINQIMMILAITQSILLVLCFIFILSRLRSVTRGFTELLSIFVQMDNNDIRKIFRFMQFLINLFDKLNEKSQKMSMPTDSFNNTTSSNMKDFEKHSSEMSFAEQQGMLSVNANLNKKIKKIDHGDEISKIRTVALILIIVFLVLIGMAIFSFNVYASISLSNFQKFQLQGFTTMKNGSTMNVILNGIFQKYRNASIYYPPKYVEALQTFQNNELSDDLLSIASGSSNFQLYFKKVYYQNFCVELSQTLQEDTDVQYTRACEGTSITEGDKCNFLANYLKLENRIGRCTSIQNGQLQKGTSIYYNFLLEKINSYIDDKGKLTKLDILEINEAQIIIDIFEREITKTWTQQSTQWISDRQTMLIILTICIFVFIIFVHLFFVEYLIANNLKNNYDVFRKMHENLIPEFVINKEKIIKAKLIKEGFMKQ